MQRYLAIPTIEEIVDAIKEVFSVNFTDYEYSNLSVTSISLSRIRVAVIAAFIGIIIAVYYSLFNRKVFGNFIHSLGGENCFSEEKAKTLSELGYYQNPAVRSAIRGGNVYKGILRCVEQDRHNAETERRRGEYEAAAARSGENCKPFKAIKYSFDFEKDHFYIPEDKAFTAETKFKKKHGSVVSAILITIVSVILLWAALKLLPELIQLADNFVGLLS